MSDKKITQLNNITGANLVDADEFVVVDISADETKAITLGELKEAFDAGSGFVRVTGDTMTGDLSFGDNDKAIFGAGSDLQIYHSGSDSIIKDGGTGDLQIRAANFKLNNAEYTTTMLEAYVGGPVSLWYNNSAKLSTTATGIDVTGTVTADGLTVDGVSIFRNLDDSPAQFISGTLGDKEALTFERNGGAVKGSIEYQQSPIGFNIGTDTGHDFRLKTNGTQRLGVASNGDISFYEDTGITPKLQWSAFNERLGLTGSDYQFYIQQGANQPWYHRAISNGNYAIHLNGTGDVMTLDSSGNVGIGTSSPTRPLSVTDTTGDGTGGIKLSSYLPTFEMDDISGGGTSFILQHDGTSTLFKHNTTERMRIDASGNLLVGKTSLGLGITGSEIRAGGQLLVTADGDNPADFNRKTSDGVIALFRKDGSTVGSIGSQGGATLSIAGAVGSGIYFGSTGVLPANGSGSLVDATRDIGSASWRNKDLYLSGTAYVGGNVGIGTPSPTTPLHVDSKNQNAAIQINANTGFNTSINFYNGGAAKHTMQSLGDGSGAFRLYDFTANSERMRIDSSGKVLVNRTTAYSDGTIGNAAFQVNANTGAFAGLAVIATATTGTAAVGFVNPNGSVGNISLSGTSTSYNTSSDYRLKTDAQPMTGASARVQALNPVNFKWLSDGTRVDGFLAHEAQAVVPEAVRGTKDAMGDEEYEVTPAVEATYDDDGNELTAAVPAVMGTRSVPDYQGIDQSKLVPLLTAALQEALTKIDDLETRLTALEG